MPQLFNRAGMSTATAGQGTLTLASAIGAVAINTASFQAFVSAGVTDGAIVSYLILDANGNWEVGTGTYTASGTTLSRTVKYSSNSNTAISLSGSAQVFITALAADGGDVLGSTLNPLRGFDTPANLQLNVSQNGATLTVAVKGNNGSDPSVTNPVFIPFRDVTGANGDPVWRTVTSALSINTNATGATLGTANSVPFRIWVVAFDNAGTVVLALWQAVTGGASPTALAPLNEGISASTTAISGSATAAGTFYTPNGTTLTNKIFRIIGYLSFDSGLATAGTYSSNPTFVQLFGPGIKKPGDIMQSAYKTGNTATASTATAFANAGDSLSISMSSAPNLIRFFCCCNGISQAGTGAAKARFYRGGTGGTQLGVANLAFDSTGITIIVPGTFVGLDAPGTTSSITYQGAIASNTAGQSVNWGNTTDTPVTSLMLEELMV